MTQTPEVAAPAAQTSQSHWMTRVLAGLFWLMAWIPATWLPNFATLLLTLGSPFLAKERRKIAANLQLIYGLAPQSIFSHMFERQVLRNQLLVFLETFKIAWHGSAVRIDGEDEFARQIQAAGDQGSGMIVATAHLGNWDLLGMLIGKHFPRPFLALAKPTKYVAANQLVEESRRKMGMQLLWTDRRSLLRDMMQSLSQGKCLGFVMDQRSKTRQGFEVQFFGQSTPFVKGPASMALRCGVPIVAAYCVRISRLHYRVFARTFTVTDIATAGEQGITQLLALEVEKAVRLYPEQWTWNYRRWKLPTPIR